MKKKRALVRRRTASGGRTGAAIFGLGMISPYTISDPNILEGMMGLRSRLKKQVGRILDQFSGEHSEAAPEERTPYARPGVPDDNAEVVMARLNRPKSLSAGDDGSDDKED